VTDKAHDWAAPRQKAPGSSGQQERLNGSCRDEAPARFRPDGIGLGRKGLGHWLVGPSGPGVVGLSGSGPLRKRRFKFFEMNFYST
jgi:hypothetical protein